MSLQLVHVEQQLDDSGTLLQSITPTVVSTQSGHWQIEFDILIGTPGNETLRARSRTELYLQKGEEKSVLLLLRPLLDIAPGEHVIPRIGWSTRYPSTPQEVPDVR